MKKILFAFFLSFLFFSCAKNSNSLYISTGDNSLKQQLQNNENALTWTEEIEKDRLKENIKTNDFTDKSFSVTVDSLKVTGFSHDKKYPFLNGFGSLDSSELSLEVKKSINGFLSEYKETPSKCSSWFENDAVFTYVLFNADISSVLDKTGEIKEWKIGKAVEFENDNLLSVPVRIICKKGQIDVIISYSIGSSKISQIAITDWA